LIAERRREELHRQLAADRRLRLLLGGERAHQREPLAFLRAEHPDPGVLSAVRVTGLRPEEGRRHHELIAEDEAVDDQVVAVDLPAPRIRGGGRAHDAEPVEPLPVLFPAARHLADEVVEPHDVAHGREAAVAQARGKKGEAALTLGRCERVERHAVAHEVRVDVAPLPPRLVPEREQRPFLLVGAERRDERVRGVGDRLRRHATRRDREQAAHGRARRDALERHRQRRVRVREIALQAFGQLLRRRARGDDRSRVANVSTSSAPPYGFTGG
jgi:hypothetical protein